MPAFVGSAFDPLIGLAGDTRRRNAIIAAGGIAFVVATALAASALGFWTLLLAFVLGNPASGAFVGLAQATLMDADPGARERNMARWTAVGSIGYVAGPVLIALAVTACVGWRGVLVVLAVAGVPLAALSRRLPSVAVDTTEPGDGGGLAALRLALRDREVVRWLTLLQAVDLLLDVFHGLLALYLVDVGGQSPVEAALAVSVWTGAGLAGDVALVGLLGRVDSRTYLRSSALATILCYPAFLLTHSAGAQLVLLAALGLLNSGWYALPKAGLYGALPGRSGTAIAVAGVGGFVSAGIPAALGLMAEQIGLGSTMWALLLAPVALLVLTPAAVRST